MIQKEDWPKAIAVFVFIMLLGGYYGRLSPETRTWVLPIGIFLVAGFVIARLKRLEYEMRASNVIAQTIVAQELSLRDTEGIERVSISTRDKNAVIIFYDDNHTSRATIEMFHPGPELKLAGERGSAVLTFNEDGMPTLTFQTEAGQIFWSAP